MIPDALVTAILSPLLLIQALLLRKHALRLPEATGARQGSSGEGAPLRVLIIGDSSAAGVGVSTQHDALAGQLAIALAACRSVEWHLIAQTGATTPAMLARLRTTALAEADVALIVLGVNDVTRSSTVSKWLKDNATLRMLLRDRTRATRLYVTQIPPLGEFPLLPQPLRWVLGRRAIRFDAALKHAISTEADTAYAPLPARLEAADMAEDGFHPGPVIYATWAKEMARRILSDGP